jgi:hypothetical protein
MTWNQIGENILCNSEYYVNICNDVSNNDLLYDNLVNQRTYFRNYFTNTFQFFSKSEIGFHVMGTKKHVKRNTTYEYILRKDVDFINDYNTI